MKGLAWKIALATAVLAVGFLVILQAQRGMTQALLQKTADAQAANQPAAAPAADAAVASNAVASDAAPKSDPFGDAASASDPSSVHHADGASGEAKNDAPKVVTPVTAPEVVDKDSGKSPAKPTASPDAKESTAANDPFADGGDVKHSAPATETKSAAPAGSEVKQASASTEALGKNSEPTDNSSPQAMPAPELPAPKLPGADGPALSDSKPEAAKAKDASAPPKQSEPPAGPQIDLPAGKKDGDQKDAAPKDADEKAADGKASGGPQLPAGPSLDLPPMTNAAPENPPPPTPKSATSNPPFPGPADGAATPPAQSEPTDKSPVKSAADAAPPSSSGGPKPFPEEGPKESPLAVPKLPASAPPESAPPPTNSPAPAIPSPAIPSPALPAPTGGATNGTPASPMVLDLTPGNAPSPNAPATGAPPTLPETKSADTSNSSTPAPTQRPAADLRSEGAADFQGDGTVGESAALGPQRPQLNIEKIAPPNALLGQPLIYSIMVRNVGQSTARDVVVEDRIPKGTKLSGTIPRAELTGKKLIWRLGTLAAGEQRKISIRVIPQEAGEIGSVATVNFVAEAAAETVVTAPRLEFKITAPSAARLGESVPFRFEVRNVGTGEARGVVIRDLIPQGLAHSAGNDLEYDVGRLLPGRSKQLTLDLKAGKVGTAVNRAVVLAEGGLTAEAKATIEISGSKVALTRTGPQRHYLGRQAVFTNTLINESSFPVDGVVLVESVPAGMEFAGATHGGQYNDGSRTIAWRIDPLSPGETRVVKSRLVPRSLGNQTSTVRLTVPNGEPVETTSQTAVEGFAAVGLDVTGVDGPVDLGEKITLHVNARNKGTVPVTNLMLTVELPEQMEVVSARGPGKLLQEPGRLKFGPVPTLEGRTTAACEIVLAARKRGDSRVRVSIQADQIDKPLAREESILILSETPEPTAAR